MASKVTFINEQSKETLAIMPSFVLSYRFPHLTAYIIYNLVTYST